MSVPMLRGLTPIFVLLAGVLTTASVAAAGTSDLSARTVDDALEFLPDDVGQRDGWRDDFSTELRLQVAAERLAPGAVALVLRNVDTALLHSDAIRAADAVVAAGLAIDTARQRGTLANRAALRSRPAIERTLRDGPAELLSRRQRPVLPTAPRDDVAPVDEPPPSSPPPANQSPPDNEPPITVSPPSPPWPNSAEGFFEFFVGLPDSARQLLLQRLHELHMELVLDLIRDRLLDQLDSANESDPSGPDGGED